MNQTLRDVQQEAGEQPGVVARVDGTVQRVLYELRHGLATPSRNARMAVVVGRLLGAAFLICFATGLYSHFLQDPLAWMHFPTRPTWLYQISQGTHITAGIACFPLILAKLYIVFPDLFQSPPVKSFAHFLERASIALFVAASLVEITIGLLNTFQWYPFPFPFRQTHYALSFVIVGSLAIHIAVKLDTIGKYWRKRDSYRADGELILHDAPEPEPTQAAFTGVTGRVVAWIDKTPASPVDALPERARASRRGFIAAMTAGVAGVVVFTGGQSFKVLDFANLFAPRKQGIGPNSLPVNRTAQAAKVTETAINPNWELTVTNGSTVKTFTRAELLALPQYTVDLPIACVEGWSQMATWKGVRLRDLADSVGADKRRGILATSLEQGSIYASTTLGPEYVRDELTLVALEVNGATLDINHGYPARMIAPGRPGVLQTKWLESLEVLS